MKISLTFQSDGNDRRYIRAEWLPVGKKAGHEVQHCVGKIVRHPGYPFRWTATLHGVGGAVAPGGANFTICRDTEGDAREAVSAELDNHGPWWFASAALDAMRRGDG